MAFLTISGTNVLVQSNTSLRTEVEVGQVRRAFSGAPRSSVRAYKRAWAIETVLMTRANADSLRTVLEAAPPLTITGDLTGSITGYVLSVQEIEKRRVGLSNEYVRLGFQLWQA